jgi:branched-chain amino acid transport system substrate-binding protein
MILKNELSQGRQPAMRPTPTKIILLFIGLLFWMPGVIQAQAEVSCERDVIVQVDDWLSKLSEKFYGDVLAFPAIFEATNAKAQTDESYNRLDNPDLIEPGWKLCIVDVGTAEEILGFSLDNAPAVDDTPVNLRGPINVGAAYAFSGPFALNGQSIRRGIELAVKEVNESQFLGEGVLQIIWEDTAGDKNQAVQAFNKLIQEDQVVAILGPTLSQSAFATDPLAQAAGVPVIGSSNTASGITEMGDYIFRTNLPEEQLIAHTVQQTQEALDLQQVSIIYDETNAFTQASYEAFRRALAEAEIEITGVFTFATGDNDFSAQLAEIQALEVDAIILNALPEEAVQFISQARQQGLAEVPVIGDSSFNSPQIFELSQEPLDEVIFSAAWNLTNPSGNTRQFVTNYEAEYGTPPDQFAAQSYTALWALAHALRQADSTGRAAIRDALDKLELIESPLGLFTFDEQRNPSHQPVLQEIRDGSFSLFE